MIAYKGFEKNLSCRGYQFKRYGINETTEANCRQNGFHCAENPLDCLVHYPNWRNSRYFVVKAFGDLDEDDRDTKISCTKIELIKELDFPTLLLRGAAYMAIHPDRPWCSLVCKETGVGNNGFVIVRGKQPKAKGRKNDLLILVQEEPDSNEIRYKDVYRRMVEKMVSAEEAVEYFLKRKDRKAKEKQFKRQTNFEPGVPKKVVIMGKEYPSKTSCYDDLKIQKKLVLKRMRDTSCSFEEAVIATYQARIEKEFHFHGEVYKSFVACCKAYGVAQEYIAIKAKREGITRQEAIEKILALRE